MKKKIAEYEVGEQVDIFLLIKTATKVSQAMESHF